MSDEQLKLSQGSIRFAHAEYEQDEQGALRDNDADATKTVNEPLEAWVLENSYIKATLVPGYGGRIISLINKATGREALYRNPFGYPYGLGKGYFVHDWLQIYGGIFPTFGPEHGKSWNQAWEMRVLSDDAKQGITVEMLWRDSKAAKAPGNFAQYRRPSGIELRYFVTLKPGRAALDTRIEITNPGDKERAFEYWTNVSLAPGSDPADPRATAGAEIIYPLELITTSWCSREPRCRQSSEVIEPSGALGVYKIGGWRHYKNWSDWGIAYAYPNMGQQNFWGVINHDNEEGLIRVADNQYTLGMKFWTFGYPTSRNVDVRTSENRPFIELWAGNVSEFFQNRTIKAGETHRQAEVYIPSAGLAAITHANDNFLADVRRQGDTLNARIYSAYPGVALRYEVHGAERTALASGAITPGASAASLTVNNLPTQGPLSLKLLADSKLVFEANVP